MARRIIAAVFFIASVAYAGNYGGGPNAFAQLSLTPRETSMGGSGSVFAEGVFASYWNPAGVLKGDTTQFTAAFISRANLLRSAWVSQFALSGSNLDHNIIGVRFKTEQEWIDFAAFCVQYRQASNIQQTELSSVDDITTISKFNSTEAIVHLSGAKKFPAMAIGLTIKGGYASFSSFAPRNYFAGFDIGFSYSIRDYLYNQGLVFASKAEEISVATVLELNRDHNLASRTVTVGLGASYSNLIISDLDLVVGLDVKAGDFMPFTVGMGLEFGFQQSYFIRSGVNLIHFLSEYQSLSFFSFGVGAVVPVKTRSVSVVKVDLAYQFFPGIGGGYLELVDSPLKLSICLPFDVKGREHK
jgi:hypothetical protein